MQAAQDVSAPAPLAPSPVQAIRERQAADCDALARLGEKVREMIERGEGLGRDGNAAAALGSLTRATATLHEMEREAHAMGGESAGGRDKVILLPVPLGTMDEWSRLATVILGTQAPTLAVAERATGWRAVEQDEGEGGS